MNPKVKIVDDFLSQELLEQLNQTSLEAKDFCHNNSFDLWDKLLTKDSKNYCEFLPLTEETDMLFPELRSKLTEEINKNFNVISNLHLSLYYWLPESDIPWHDDGGPFTASATLYLNDTWDRSHGGLFCYNIDNKITEILPNLNRCIWSAPGTIHCVTPTTADAPIRRTLQIRFLRD